MYEFGFIVVYIIVSVIEGVCGMDDEWVFNGVFNFDCFINGVNDFGGWNWLI